MQDEETDVDAEADSNSEPDYAFEGFEVDFSEKIALIPAEARK